MVITLQPSGDAATANWGNGWRMPTADQWEELFLNTTNTWMTNGLLFTASNGKTLFLPAAGCRLDGELYETGSTGAYWSSSIDTDGPNRSWYFYFNSGDYYMNNDPRFIGLSVRPVRFAR